MPLQQTLLLHDDCVAVLWKIEEEEATLRASLPLTAVELAELDSIRHPAQRTEWLACRAAVCELVESQGMIYAGMAKDEHGKPFLIGQEAHVSISHTLGWAAAVWHPERAVGIDIEPFRSQFGRVVPRVLSDDEIADAGGNLSRLAVYWCAKEALYKLYGKRQLTFREHLHVEPFEDGAEWLVGHVRLPDYVAKLTIRCYLAGPGLVAVAL
ncbi:4'-phosphopantetheinyl transferase family protein [Tellurirhabdus bombi]|uniref:4'-phosphopantetheinyl transferase family protein n=1 Tax=Tellurirhabdus bombi TaxID=2907205 RepID=UPI001F473B40|nr:4'-phosphopantetheinyl transferase superfamily protein [Tellurirhabdus bombi]